MTYSTTNIEIYLINDLSHTGKDDDKIVIKKDLCSNEFEILYTEYSKGSTAPIVQKLTGLHHAKVLEYVYMVLKNQYLDDEPYAYLQFNLPAMPRILMAGEKFHEVYCREHIQELMSLGLDNLEFASALKQKAPSTPVQPVRYPVTTSQPERNPGFSYTMPGLRPQHLFFDDD